MAKKRTSPKQEQATPAPVDTKAGRKQKKSNQKQQTPAENPRQQKNTGKTKSIKKEQKPTRQQAPVQQPQKKARSSTKQETEIEIFTPDFYARLNTFQTYYKQVLELKSSSSNSNLSDELTSVNNRVRQALQEASSQILKGELVSLQQWIQGQQQRLTKQIQTVERCLQQTRKSLEAAKAFTVDQINGQLTLIERRIAEKQSQLQHYGVLLSRSRGIYQEEQAQKVEVRAENNNENINENNGQNNEEHPVEQDLELDLQ